MARRGAWRTCWVAAGCAVAVGCGAGASKHSSTAGTRAATNTGATSTLTVMHSPPRSRPHTRHPHHKPPPDAGTLPQTMQLPSANSRVFRAEMAALWRAIRTGSTRAGLGAFFPEAAYVQVKEIGDPRSDWRYRLVGDYALDIGAAHALLGARGHDARLIAVHVPETYAHWVPPGACYNRIGYYEVPNSRLVYRDGGDERSIGIASMISWRGVWYVVHLGAVTREAAAAVVDDPSEGAGKSVPSSTC